MRSRGLSKSPIMAGIQCSKRLYLETYHRELVEESADKEALFDDPAVKAKQAFAEQLAVASGMSYRIIGSKEVVSDGFYDLLA